MEMHENEEVFPPHDRENGTNREKEQTPLWNEFENEPRKSETGTNSNSEQYEFFVKAVKLLTYVVVACIVLFSAVSSKATLLLMTSQLKKDTVRSFCNKNLDVERKFMVELPIEERVLWTWVLIFTYFVPQIATFIRSLQLYLFKKRNKKGNWKHFPILFLTETLPVIGTAILIFCILPELDVVKAAMLTNAFCFVPGIVGAIYRNTENFDSLDTSIVMILDITCLIAQSTSFILWPLLERNTKLYLIPISAIFISFGWWQNYVDENTTHSFLKSIAKKKRKFGTETHSSYVFISITNCAIFFVSTLMIFWVQEGEISSLFINFREAFSDRTMNVTEVDNFVEGFTQHIIEDTYKRLSGTTLVYQSTPLIIFLMNTISSCTCYAFAKFASKVSIQKISFAFPIHLTVPVLLSVLIGISGEYLKDECAYINILPEYLFYTPPPFYLLRDFLTQQYAWAWLLWLLSQVWITYHVWIPRSGNLAKTEHLFLKPMYDPFLIDQSVCMNRRRDHIEQMNIYENGHPTIYVCGTMWREEQAEMTTFMESIMRLDEDHCNYLIAKECVHRDIPYYYRLECHVFFDQAFTRDPKSVRDPDDPELNEYVLNLIKTLEEAAKEIHGQRVKLGPPKKFSTPYGGRIEWILPGRTKFIVHLKDSVIIRAKKRWSQVMYMYYLIGYKLKCRTAKNKEDFFKLSKNTFILALDGDIDFKPEAMHLLIEYMKINDKLGAACGRIHPVGSGALAWYQVFEYAVGHWFQKATEHVIGCVLCSPGCFSLFRTSALSENRVMAKYTTIAKEARHRLQYDQGEDRWLCTLILKAGYRVEYSAASDSYTHCPVQFKGFYNQRKRWIPSTMANIVDVLEDHKYIVKNNDFISMIYIYYQMFLMVGTIIGPGTIFLMLVGASATVFEMDQWTSFLINLLPLLTFVLVCSVCSADHQVKIAAILSSLYGLLMMAVLIGVLLQIQEDGIMAPTSLFFFFMVAEFVFAALIHPKEFYCLKYGIIYYVTVPSMYMLLMIYSVFNVHDVSWGTRDEGVDKSSAKESNEGHDDKNKKKSGKNKKKKNSIKNILKRLIDLMDTSEATEKRAEQPRVQESPSSETVSIDTFNEKEKKSWFDHKSLKEGKVGKLKSAEVKFWEKLIEEYLQPIDEEEPTKKKKMKDLRDRMVSSFFMINALFVLVVFILTLKKDLIHLNWPYNAKVNFTFIENENEVQIMKDYLHLEPIGFVFLVTFGGLLLIQSFGMVIHRFGTFSQIIANTSINWLWEAENDAEKVTKNVTKYNAVERVKQTRKFYRERKNGMECVNGNSQVVDLVEAYKNDVGMCDNEDYERDFDKTTGVQLKELLRQSRMYRTTESPRDSIDILERQSPIIDT